MYVARYFTRCAQHVIEGGVSHSIAFIFNSRDQMRSSSLHYIGCKVLLYCRITLGLAPGCAHVYMLRVVYYYGGALE